jgi:hypothetical protein
MITDRMWPLLGMAQCPSLSEAIAKAPLVSGTHPSDWGAEMLTLPQKPPHPVCR